MSRTPFTRRHARAGVPLVAAAAVAAALVARPATSHPDGRADAAPLPGAAETLRAADRVHDAVHAATAAVTASLPDPGADLGALLGALAGDDGL